mmetsp:Transcript_28638/g.46024  ORF Transcript_28638/g.46024 Transcript_28638/m.46024 type:complete len:212 (-) Transcript_28638:125-760(-)
MTTFRRGPDETGNYHYDNKRDYQERETISSVEIGFQQRTRPIKCAGHTFECADFVSRESLEKINRKAEELMGMLRSQANMTKTLLRERDLLTLRVKTLQKKNKNLESLVTSKSEQINAADLRHQEFLKESSRKEEEYQKKHAYHERRWTQALSQMQETYKSRQIVAEKMIETKELEIKSLRSRLEKFREASRISLSKNYVRNQQARSFSNK